MDLNHVADNYPSNYDVYADPRSNLPWYSLAVFQYVAARVGGTYDKDNKLIFIRHKTPSVGQHDETLFVIAPTAFAAGASSTISAIQADFEKNGVVPKVVLTYLNCYEIASQNAKRLADSTYIQVTILGSKCVVNIPCVNSTTSLTIDV